MFALARSADLQSQSLKTNEAEAGTLYFVRHAYNSSLFSLNRYNIESVCSMGKCTAVSPWKINEISPIITTFPLIMIWSKLSRRMQSCILRRCYILINFRVVGLE